MVYWFPRAAVTHDPKLGDLKQHRLPLPQFWTTESEMGPGAGFPLATIGEKSFPCHFRPQVLPALLGSESSVCRCSRPSALQTTSPTADSELLP